MQESNYEFMGKGHVPVWGWTKGVPVEDVAKKQLLNIASMPFVHHHVAVMPDVHKGIGATIGTVIATKDVIIPASVGVDIGCGMMAMRTTLTASDLPDSLAHMRMFIEGSVPHGRTDNGGLNDRGAWTEPSIYSICAYDLTVKNGLAAIIAKHPKLERSAKRAPHHLGTLGGGNHFIEVCLDEEQRVWVMLHSGSRGIGNAIGSYFIEKAKEEMARWHINLIDKDLAYLPEGSQYFQDYIDAMKWAQDFAWRNREVMMKATLMAMAMSLGKTFWTDEVAINCHHNYVQKERHYGANVWLTRKGAVSAREGQLGIIPGSMGAKSYIVAGKGNHEAFHSCSHGAGRAMGRREAEKRFTVEDHIKATEGVECKKDLSVLDETPGAYKDVEKVMEAQRDLVEIKHTLKQVLCIKG